MVEDIELVNTITDERIAMSMTTTNDYVLSYADWSQVQGSHNMHAYVGQVGKSVTNTVLDVREVEIVGWVIADSCEEMAERKLKLNRFVTPTQPLNVFYKGYSLTFYPESSVAYSQEFVDNNDTICKFLIRGIAADPTFTSANEKRMDAAGIISLFHFPLVIPNQPDPPGGFVFGYRRPSLITKVANRGAVPTGMRILFTARGAVTNPYIILVETQEQFKINKSLVAGEKIEVSTVVGGKYIRGTLGGKTTNYFRYRDLDSVWLQLAVGENNLRYGADNGDDQLDVEIYFYDRLLEVEGCD